MPAFDSLQTLKNDLIRKTLNGSVFIAQYSATTVSETSLFDTTTGDLHTLPSGFSDLGYLSDAGASFSRSVSISDVTSWQSVSPTRSDVTADVTSVDVVAQETTLNTIGMYTGADPTAIQPATANGVIRVNKPARPTLRYYRLLVVSVDETALGEVAICRYLPRAIPTSYNKQDFGKGTEIQWDVTFTGHVDDALGFSESWMFGGAGWKARLTAMGFTPVP